MSNHTRTSPPGAGKSSFDLIDPARLLAALPLKSGGTLLDLGCGQGRYTLALAGALEPGGLIYAVDLWAGGVEELKAQARARGLDQILALVADVSRRLPLESAAVDLCLLATVLHDLVEAGTAAGALAEVARVVKPGGILAIVEFKKIPGPPGPPLNIRLAPAEVAALVRPYGFQQVGEDLEVGPYNYLLKFARGPATADAP